ncbi:Signal transduction histidine kinase [Amycolatopsis arida]|uniref:histidine kinase n=1 Tax=Amycolatopsis arida TaxID=587909 RepID=A0A1I5QQF5_9PSEU|nr:nitrate- and nitrite sensing domain-containing protein [Amycolatopsis arida]TDX98926.1 signal transduction histidine kinase [Amycolatopsis arida]SFP48504.1 Signal transduction histidine kinase [Amycolatopsis arida]
MTRRNTRAPAGDATEPGQGAGGRWRLRNWPLRTKLLAVLIIPTLALVILVGLRVHGDLDRATDFAEAATRVRVDDRIAEVVHHLQRERDLTVRHVAAGRAGDIAELRAQRERVDAAVGAFDREFAAAEPNLSEGAVDAFRAAEERLGLLTGLRFTGEHSQAPADAVLRGYSGLISGLLDVGDEAAAEFTDRDLTRTRLAVNALARLKDGMSVERAVVAEALTQGRLSDDGERALLGTRAAMAAARNDFAQLATPDQQRMYDDTVIGLVVDIGNAMVESVLGLAQDDQPLTGLDPVQWDTSSTYTINLVEQVQDGLLVQLQRRTDELAGQAREAAIRNAAVVFGVLLVGGVLAAIVARSLLRPLRMLRRTALDVAEHRLPAAVEEILADPDPRPEGTTQRRGVSPVPVFTREELGQVARAFDAVYGEAVRLAGEQAMLRENVNSMFVNLSRRSQELVERQLSVLDRMEADEQDPETLGGLFELDHLATRMRRNSENLLVLSGQDVGDPLPGAIAAEEIIGAALSEVEHYQRVEVSGTPELAVRGEAVSDLVHVVSELLENATQYSPEAEPVFLTSSATVADEWRIEITDRGAGMPLAEIDRANERLTEPPQVDVEVSRRMGLYVVARLARRHDISVRLSPAPEGGLTATVVVPAALVTDPPPVPPPPEPEPRAPEATGFAEPAPAEWPSVEPDPPPQPPQPPLPPLPRLAEPPKRAPVVEWESPPEWPTEDDDEAVFDFDGPTERMPAYQAVLSQWFDAVAAGERPPDPPPTPATDTDVAGFTEAGLPKRIPRPDRIPAPEDTPAMDEEWMVSRAPEVVRLRMSSLQNGVRQGRERVRRSAVLRWPETEPDQDPATVGELEDSDPWESSPQESTTGGFDGYHRP